MANDLSHTLARRGLVQQRPARPYWNAYGVGFVLGLVLLASYLVAGRGLGATGAFSSVATALAGLVSPTVADHAVHSRYWNHGAPLLSWTVFLLIGVFAGSWLSARQAGRFRWQLERGPRVSPHQRLGLAFGGGFVAAFGAKIAHGCTSGQALTGGAILNVGSLAFMAAVFASAYALAWFLRREWL